LDQAIPTESLFIRYKIGPNGQKQLVARDHNDPDVQGIPYSKGRFLNQVPLAIRRIQYQLNVFVILKVDGALQNCRIQFDLVCVANERRGVPLL
jgi:hypothetical protein